MPLNPPQLPFSPLQEAVRAAGACKGSPFIFSACSVHTWPYRVEAVQRPGLREHPGWEALGASVLSLRRRPGW